MGLPWQFRINSESANEEVFKEFKMLGPKHDSLEHYVVGLFHFAAAIAISVIQFNKGLGPWFYGCGIVTPILLIANGFVYSYLENDSWYREQMVPFISRLVSTTEIETDRYCQYHRRLARIILIFGWFVILLCQWVWTFGLTQVMPFFAGDDFILRFVGELVAYAIFFGPFVLYALLLLPITSVLKKLLQSRYSDITHLIDIENKWTKESQRRAKDPESVLEDASSDNQWF